MSAIGVSPPAAPFVSDACRAAAQALALSVINGVANASYEVSLRGAPVEIV